MPVKPRETLAQGHGQADSDRKRQSCRRNSSWRRLQLECLEDRILPTLIPWDGGPLGTGTDWNTPANWVGDVLPGAVDDAQIGSSFSGITITSSGAVTVRSLTSAAALQIAGGTFTLGAAASQIDAALTVSGGTLRLSGTTLNGTGTLTNAATLNLFNGTVNVPSVNQSLLVVQGPDTWNGTLGNLASGTLRVYGTGSTSNASLTVANGFTNYGTIELTGDPGWTGGLTVNSGTLTNAAGGTVRVLAGGSRSLTAPLDNQGLLEVQASFFTLGKPGTTFNNSGTVSVSGASQVFVPQSGTGLTFTNTGTLNIGSGANVYVTQGTFHQNAGTIMGAGTMTLTSVAVDFAGDFSNRLASLQLNNSSVTASGTLMNSSGKSLTLSGTTTLNTDLHNEGILWVQSGTLNGQFSNAPGGILRVGGVAIGSAFLTVANGFTNQGAIELTGQQNFSTELTINNGTLTNAVGGIIRILPSGARVLAAQLDNQGTLTAQLDVNTSLTLNKPGAAHTNSGTISFTGGSFNVGLAGMAQTLTNSGVLDVGGNATLVLATGLTNDGAGILTGQPSGAFAVRGDLLGATINGDHFAPQATVRFTGPGSAGSPQLLEVLGEDRGASAAGFSNNFALAKLALASSTYVRLVDSSNNAPGNGPEALYVNQLVVPDGTTLDLDSFKLYARQVQIDGTVVGGTVTLAPDSGPMAMNSATAGAIGATGELDEWTFYGRAGQAVTIVANPGASGAPAPLPPTLSLVDVRLLSPTGAQIGSGVSASSGQAVTLQAVQLPDDGTYRIQVRAAPGGDQGNYALALWNASVNTRPLVLNRQTSGTLETPFEVDDWTFTAAANQQVTFDWINAAPPTLQFKLTGPNGFAGFNGLTGDSGLVTLPYNGVYTLEATAGANQGGGYAFRLLETSQTVLTLGTPFTGPLIGPGQAQLFRVDLPVGQQLRFLLDGAANGNRNELYAQFGSPPTRDDFQFSATAAAADQQMYIPTAAPGSWFVLLYSSFTPSLGSFTLTADAGALFLSNTSPVHLGNGTDMTLTLSGAGFDQTTIVELLDSGGATYPADGVSLDTPTHLTATFLSGSVPPGTYSVRARRPTGGEAILPNSFQVVAGGQSKLEVNLIVPGQVNYIGTVEYLYVEYANTGDAPMTAPLLVLHGSNKALFTVDESRLAPGARTSAKPAGFSDTVQINGSGATPGLLQPGEYIRVPVYFVGLGKPLDFGDNFLHTSLSVVNANTTPIDWPSLKDTLRPPGISAEAWTPIFANLVAQIGPTWGDFQNMLSDNARYLGRVGETVNDVDSLWRFEVEQAIGLNPVSTLASATDIQVDAPGLPITFTRVFSTSTVGRYVQGPLGRGWAWAEGWDRTLTLQEDGTAVVSGIDGHTRRFEPDSRFAGRYFSQDGDHGTLSGLSGGAFVLREPDGMVTRFRNDGRVEYVEDANGNRITPTWTGAQLTRLTHSSGQFLQINYSGGRVDSLVDQSGRTVTYAYDASHEHLLAVQGIDGQTTEYSYGTGVALHGLESIQYPDNTHALFTYDTHGRLESMARDGNAERVSFTYDSAGRVTATDALGHATKVFFDDQGQLAAVEDALGRRTLFSHDKDFNLTGVTDALGQNSLFQYDVRGNLTRATNPLGQVTKFGYTPDFNRLSSMTDARGNPLNYGYDSRGNLTSITYADGSVERFIVDARGELDGWTNRRGQPVDYQVDADGRLQRRDLPDGSFAEYHYNARGNVIQAIDATGTTQLEYLDPQNPDRVTKITYPDGRFLQYAYQTGRRTSMVDQDGFTTNYFYDAAGRLEFLRNGAGDLIVQYHYDPAGRLAREDKDNGTSTEYQYDAAGQLEHLINKAPDGTVNSRFDYVYDTLGRRTRMTALDGVWDYTYDGIGELTRAVFTSNTPASLPNQDLQYVYDAASNRIRTVLNGVTTNYVTNNLNEYTQIGTATLAYDLDGNQVSRTDGGVTTTYGFDALNRLTSVTMPGGAWSYLYDSFDNRSATEFNGQRTSYLIDPFGLGDVVGEYDAGGSLVAHFTHGLGLTSSTAASGEAAYYDFDAIGSTAGLSGATGTYLNSYGYLPFGESLRSVEAIANPFQFVGQFGVMQEGNGLDFMRARFCAPLEGRFVSADPIGLAGRQVNFYGYVRQDPISSVDPEGLEVDAFLVLAQQQINERGNRVRERARQLRRQDLYDQWQVSSISEDDCNVIGGLPSRPSTTEAERLSSSEEYCLVSYANVDCVANQGIPISRQSVQVCLFPLKPKLAPPAGSPPVPENSSALDVVHGKSRLVHAMDPNEKTGPAGFGPSRFIAADSPLSYRVGFENEADATAPAHRVIVTDRLDANLDWDTLAWTAAGFGDVVLSIPDGTRHYQTTVPITQNGHTFQVEIELDLDPQTGVVTAVFDSVDPVTGLPPDALTGFLPPEDESGRGQGFLSYVVRPKPGLPTGTTLRNIARIVFDGNDPIDTNQIDPHDPTQGTDPEKEAFNTLDAGDPTSSVAGLPATTPTTAFTVNWLGQDDQSGSGVGTYTIYVSDNGSPYAPWLVRVPSTSAEYTGVNGHTYAFYSVAADNVGHLEDAPASPDATTHIAVPVSVVSMTINGNSSTLAGSQRSLVKSIAYVFNQAVSLADGAFSIAVHAGSTGTLPTLIWTSPDGGTTWVVTFSGSGVVAGSIADGRYDITLHAGAVSTAPGGTLAADRTDAFFRLYGDITGNGQVDFADFFQFRAALGSQSGDSNFKAAFDYNGDGRVDFVDFFQFRTRLGTTI